MATIKISDEVKDVLEQATIGTNSVVINGQLDRKLYTEVNKVLEAAGGKWNKKAKAHLFEGDPRAVIGLSVEKEEIEDKKKTYQAFFTPADLAQRIVKKAGIKKDSKVLEPSAGDGAIADAVKKTGAEVFCVELQDELSEKLVNKGYVVYAGDFLEIAKDKTLPYFDTVVMNPPFTKDQDIDHVRMAYSLLPDGGRLVSVMSPGFTFGETKKRKSFRELVEDIGEWESLPEGSFKESGTNVSTVLVTLYK